MSTEASTRPPLSATDNKLGWRREGKGACGRGGQVSPVFPFTFLLLYLSAAFPVPMDLENRSFFPCCATIRR